MKNIDSYSKKILDELNQFLEANKQHTICLSNVFFVLEKDILYSPFGDTNRVAHSKIVSLDKFDSIISPLIKGGPSWIHANLIRTKENIPLVEITIGTIVGNPNPSINVSFEPNLLIEIMN